jgi:hypothetical protein
MKQVEIKIAINSPSSWKVRDIVIKIQPKNKEKRSPLGPSPIPANIESVLR